jgi:hypothetical protein
VRTIPPGPRRALDPFDWRARQLPPPELIVTLFFAVAVLLVLAR